MRYSKDKLVDFAINVLQTVGLTRENAQSVAEALVFADIRGADTHGLSKLSIYTQRIQRGAISVQGAPKIISKRDNIILIDGQNALGQINGIFATTEAINAARKGGWAFSFVGNSNHFGAAAYYATMASRDGMIGMALSNANPTMAPWGGKKAMIGTNPMAIAIPAAHEVSIVLDMATSKVARGKVIAYANENKPIPSGWGMDADGNETTDPNKALNGLLMPLGGPKGSGLAMIIDIFCGVLSQSAFLTDVGHLYSGLERSQRVGHMFAALNVESLMPKEQFLSVMDQYIQTIKACPPAANGERVYLPGELEYLTAEQQLEEGIHLSESTRQKLNQLAQELGLNTLSL